MDLLYPLDRVLERCSGARLTALGVVLALAIGALDWATGGEVSLSEAYVLPIYVFSWVTDERQDFFVALGCAGIWLCADALAGSSYSHPVVPYWNAGVRFAFFYLVSRMLTRLRADVAERTLLTGELTRLLDERDRAQRALEQKALELARSNADLEQYASVAAHDLKSPLVVVGGYIQLLRQRYRGSLEADAAKFIDGALEGVHRLEALVDDLLAYARAGATQTPREAVRCDDAVDEAVSNLAQEIAAAEVTVTRDPLPEAVTDGPGLVQVFQNLLSNAIKYRGDEPPRIHVRARRDGGHWVLSVEDNGVGIDPEYFERLFTLFGRLPATSKLPGTGIGLAICRRIVERGGGRIWVESDPGKGTTFSFTIPDPPED